MKQLTFANYSEEFKEYWRESGRKVHGGAYASGKRKTARPFSSRKPMHIVLRAKKAVGALSMLSPHNRATVNSIVYDQATNANITLHKYSNNGNHLHLVLQAKQRQALQRLLRVTAGLIARRILKAEKGAAKGKFWDALAFTRIAEWGKDFKRLTNYVIQNVLEAAGVIEYKPRKHRLCKQRLRKQQLRIHLLQEQQPQEHHSPQKQQQQKYRLSKHEPKYQFYKYKLVSS